MEFLQIPGVTSQHIYPIGLSLAVATLLLLKFIVFAWRVNVCLRAYWLVSISK